MQIIDAEKLLGITITGNATLEARFEAAKEYVKDYCRNDFLDSNGNEIIPMGAKMGIALMIKAMGETQNVQSQSLGDMSKSFFEGATGREAKRYLKPYVRLVV